MTRADRLAVALGARGLRTRGFDNRAVGEWIAEAVIDFADSQLARYCACGECGLDPATWECESREVAS